MLPEEERVYRIPCCWYSSAQDRPFTRASWSERAPSNQKFRLVWTFPHRPCHCKEGPPCRFGACPARCKCHARALLPRHLRWFYPSRSSYRHHRSLCKRTVGDRSASCQDRHRCQVRYRHPAITSINGKPVHGSPTSREASIGHVQRWRSCKRSSSPQPRSVYAPDDGHNLLFTHP